MTNFSLRITGALLLLTGVACSTPPPSSAGSPAVRRALSAEAPLNVVATIGMISDVVAQVGGEFVRVKGLMGPGVDPHLYKASEGDIATLGQAEVIFYNGLNLEGKMNDLFVKMARNRPTVAVTEGIPLAQLREPPEFAGHYDPHVWFDVSLWQQAVTVIADTLATLDPPHTAVYRERAAAYQQQLATLHTWCKATLQTVPKSQRVLITAHDAFGYFGRAYDVEVVGLQGISTVAEFGVADVNRLVDLLVSRNIPAVFVESSIPQRSIEAVVAGARARGHAVAIGGTLYSDALGASDGSAATYIGMVRTNVETIVRALSDNSLTRH